MRVGIIGGSIEGLPAQCLEASGDARRWDVVYLNRERAARLKSPILRYLAILLEFLWATIRIPLVDVVLVVFVNRLSSWYVRSAHLFGKKCVLYWLGSDVRTLGEDLLSDGGLREADAQISYSEGNIVELRKCGVDAQLLVLPTRLADGVADMPDSHAVLLSLPDARKEFYGYRDLMRLVDDYPDVEFHVVRSNHPEYYDRSNIVFEGMLDREQMDKVFDRVSISIRWPEHDGTSLVLMESALKGKYIITRNPFPCGVQTDTYKGLCAALDEILALPLEPCWENRMYALRHFTQERAGSALAEVLDAVMSNHKERRIS